MKYLLLILIANGVHAQHHSFSASDTRQPVYLLKQMAEHQKQNMREHLEAIRDIIQASGESNFTKIKETAKRLGQSPQMNMMCNHMGQATPGFTPMALKMHSEADKIIEAADKKDVNAVLKATHSTLQACTNCHSLYKQQVVTEEEWNKLINKKAK